MRASVGVGSGVHHGDPLPAPLQRRGDAGAHERGLAGSRRPDDGQHRRAVQPADALGDLGVAAEERLRVTEVVAEQAEVRARIPRIRPGRVHDERWVLAQDRPFQRDELGAGIQSQLRHQEAAGPLQGPQRLGLPPCLVLRQCEQRPAPLPQGRVGDPRLRLGQHLGMPARLERRVEPGLLRLPPQLLEAFRLDAARLPRLQIDQRPSPPEAERLAERIAGAVGFAEREQLPPAPVQPFEARGVDVVRGDREPVSVRRRLDRIGAQRAPQPQHASRDHLLPRRGRLLPPERVGEAIGADHLAGADGERGEHDAVARAERRRIPVDEQRPKTAIRTTAGPACTVRT